MTNLEADRLQLTGENYFSDLANAQYLSVSQYKSFLSCEAMTMAKINGIYSTKSENEALLFGSLFHKWNEGEKEFNDFLLDNPQMFSTRGTTKGQLKATYSKVYDLIYRAEKDPVIRKALQGEKEKIFTAELFGIWWKICIDSYNPNLGYFADLKSMADIHGRYYKVEEQRYVDFISYYKYDLQMVVYSEIERIANNRNDNLNPLLVVITKESPPDAAIFKGFLDYKDMILAEVEMHTPRIIDLKNGIAEPKQCGRCEYCRSVKKTPIHILEQFKNKF